MEQKTTTRCERILAAFSHLKKKGLVKTQQDVADMMEANKTTISQAFKGNEAYLTDKFLSRFNSTFNDMFNIGWLLTGRGVMLEGVRTLFKADVPDHQRKYIDAFKLMFLLIGINTVDLLTTATIENGRVVYIRAKTHRPYSVKLEPEAADIIARYPSSRGHLISLGDGLKDYRGVTYRMNEALKSVLPGVTTYTARYSWATIAASLDIPKETIARALGHGGHSVTDIYIDFDQRKVDDANRRVIDWVLYGRK